MLNSEALRQNIAARKAVLPTRQKAQETNAARPTSSRKPTNQERVAPHSDEAERGVLSSMLQDPANAIPEASRACQSWFFYNPSNRTVFETLRDFWDSGAGVDLITYTQYLRDKGILESLGGVSYVTELFTFVPTASAIAHYVEIVRQKAMLRELISAGTGLVRGAHGNIEGLEEITQLAEDFGRKIDRIKHESGGPNGSQRFDIASLRAFDAKHDPDCLLGNRYMVRGGNCLWAGGSGYGKSSLMMQTAVYLATGTPIYGLRAVRPLKQLIIQAENDEGDLSEQLNGVFDGIARLGDINLEANAEQIEKNIGIHRVVGKSGPAFLNLLDTLLEIDRPDMVWIDPLFSFAGCDLVNSEKTGKFLREGLFPIFVKRKVCGNVLHHIGKPVRDAKQAQQMSAIDYQYLGFGTSEIQNSFRAVNILVPCKGTATFKLVFSKRGERAGAKSSDGDWTREVFLKHSAPNEGISWVQVEEPEEEESKGGRKSHYTAAMILGEMSVVHPMTASALQRRMYQEKNMSRATFFNLWEELKEDGKIEQREDGWIRVGLKRRQESSEPDLLV